MVELTITSKNQITLRKDLMRQLGLRPGDKVQVEVSGERKATLTPSPKSGDLSEFFGCLYDPKNPVLTIEKINEIIADGWAGIRR